MTWWSDLKLVRLLPWKVELIAQHGTLCEQSSVLEMRWQNMWCFCSQVAKTAGCRNQTQSLCILSANTAEHGGKIQNLWDCYHWKWSLELSMEHSMNNPVYLKWTDKTSGLFAVQWQRQALEPGTKKHSRKIATQKEQLQMKLPLD